MLNSRRSFLVGSSALLASSACSGAFEGALGNINPKKGLAGSAPSSSGLLTRWYYNWSSNPSAKGMPAAYPSIRFLPMVWGWYPGKTPSLLDGLRAQHPSLLLGFNEPDHKDQSNIPVETALEAWPLFQEIASELVSPAAANPLGPWMQNFMRGVDKRKLRVDSIAVHHYGPPSAAGFLNLLSRVHDLYQRPIWVTEFAVADWQAKYGASNRFPVSEVADFMRSVCPEMNKIPWIKGYAWFPFPGKSSNALQTSVLFDASGNLNTLGKIYSRL